MSVRRNIPRVLRGALAIVSLAALPALAQRLVVISSMQTDAYRLAAGGIARLGIGVESLQVAPEQERAIAATLARGGRDTAIVTFGAAAAAVVTNARSSTPGAPVVHCMVPGTANGRGGTAITVPLEIPFETHALWLKRLLPQARTVGILFDPAQEEATALENAAAFRRAGFRVVLEPVANSAVLPLALQRLQSQVDVLHALPDNTVYAREHARALLLFSFRHQIPLAGPTESWVKTGALFALDWDYQDLGRYCGELALRQLAGAKAPAPEAPRARVIANMRTAEQLRIQWDDATRRLIDQAY